MPTATPTTATDYGAGGRRTGFEPDALRVNRRAIFCRDLSVWGFELTCLGDRSEPPDSADRLGGEVTLLNALAELGVRRLVAEKMALFSVGTDTLRGRIPLPLSGEGSVLDLHLQGEPLDRELLEAVDDRLDEGFQLALSGETWVESARPLIERAQLVRIPFEALQRGVLDGMPKRPAARQLWIDGVNQLEHFPIARKAGPHYYSGDFLLKPSAVSSRRAPRNVQVLMELMTKLREPNVGFAELEEILRRDAGLSVTLLRFLNSAGFGLKVQVSNIRQAVALLGISEFSKWVTLVGLGAVSQKPNEVLVTALVRAKTCELMASGGQGGAAGGTAFMAGLFSLLDAMMNQPLEKVLGDLPVSDNLRAALLYQTGYEGEILAAVLDHERGLYPEEVPLNTADLFDSWQQAVVWADSLRGSLPKPRSSRPSRGRS